MKVICLVLILCYASVAFSARCDDYGEDIGGWTYNNLNPTVGNSSITLTNTGILKVITNNGFGMFLNYTPVFPISIANTKTFSFAMRGNNTHLWQGNNPIVYLQDGNANEVSFKSYVTTLSKDGITWSYYNILIDFQFGYYGSNFNPNNKISRISFFTDTFDIGYSIELDNITFLGSDGFCRYSVKGTRFLDIGNTPSWSYIQELPWDGVTNITTSASTVRITTTTGFGLWNTFTNPSTSGGDRFTFDIKGNNTTPTGWQGNMPKIIFTDDLQCTATFTPTRQLVTRDAVTWNTISFALSGSSVDFTASISANFNRYSIKNITFFLDTWEAGFTTWIRNAFFESVQIQDPK